MDLLGLELELATLPDRAHRLRSMLKSLTQAPSLSRITYVLIDCPPSLNLLTINALAAADAVLVPLQCEFFALEGSASCSGPSSRSRRPQPEADHPGHRADDVRPAQQPVRQVVADVRGFMGDKVYETVIPRNVRISEAPSHGKPALLYDLKCAGSQAYLRLASEVIQREGRVPAAA